MSHTGVSRRRGALIIGDNSCGALLLRVRMISPTRLPKCMTYASNMPKRDIYFSFLHGGDMMENKYCRWRCLNLCTDGEDSSMIVGGVSKWDLVICLPRRGREKFTISGRWISPSSPIRVSGLRFCDPNTSAPSRCGSWAQTSSPLSMSSKTFCNIVGWPVRRARRWAPLSLSSYLLGPSPSIPPLRSW